MKRHMILFLLAASITQGYGQTPEVPQDFKMAVSDEFKTYKIDDRYVSIFDEKGKAIFILHQPHKRIMFTWFDDQLKKTGESDLLLDDLPSNYDYEGFSYVSGKLYLMYSVLQRASASTELYSRQVDFIAGKFTGVANKILEGKKILGGGVISGIPRFRYFNDPDSTHLMIVFRTESEIKNNALNNLQIFVQVNDADMQKIWSKELVMPYKEDMMEIKGYYLDSKGNSLVIIRAYDEKFRDERGVVRKFHYELLQCNQSEQVLKTSLDAGKKYLNFLKVKEDLHGKILCAGYYTNTETSLICDGVYTMYPDLSKENLLPESQKYYPFTDTIKKSFAYTAGERKQKGRARDDKKSESNMNLDQIFFDDEGNILITGEESYHYQSMNANDNFGYGVIVATKILASGELKWMTGVRREHQSFLSYEHDCMGSHLLDGNLVILYSELDKNLSLPPNKIPFPDSETGPNKRSLAYLKFDSNGNAQKGKICDEKMFVDLNSYGFQKTGDRYLMKMVGFSKHNFMRLSIN